MYMYFEVNCRLTQYKYTMPPTFLNTSEQFTSSNPQVQLIKPLIAETCSVHSYIRVQWLSLSFFREYVVHIVTLGARQKNYTILQAIPSTIQMQ